MIQAYMSYLSNKTVNQTRSEKSYRKSFKKKDLHGEVLRGELRVSQHQDHHITFINLT